MQQFPWGTMEWIAAASLGNTSDVSVAKMVLQAGQDSPRHFHPNCDEVLHLVAGSVELFTDKDELSCLKAGDSAVLPQGLSHALRNPSNQDAVILISYASGCRKYQQL